MIHTIALNPAIDRTVVIENFTLGGVNRILSQRTDPAGKGVNVAITIKSLGGRSRCLGILGGSGGSFIASCLDELGIENNFVMVREETRVNLKVADPIAKTTTDINQQGHPVEAFALERVFQKLMAGLSPDDIVVLSGSLPVGAPPDTYRRWITACKQKQARVVLDTEGEPFQYGLEAAPFCIKPNRAELGKLLGRELNTLEEIVQAARELLDTGIQHVVISMSADGAVFATKDKILRAEGLPVAVRNTVGTGDALAASLALSFERQHSVAERISWAIATSAAKAQCEGTQPARLEDVRPLVEQVRFYEI